VPAGAAGPGTARRITAQVGMLRLCCMRKQASCIIAVSDHILCSDVEGFVLHQVHQHTYGRDIAG
jgi:hypothetical protein